MEIESISQKVRERGHGRLRAFVSTYSDDKGVWYVGHIYGMGDDDTSHWVVKRRKPEAILKAMSKRFVKYNSNKNIAVLDQKS